MKLISKDYNLTIEIKENHIPVLVIENVDARLNLINQLNQHISTNSGEWILSDGIKELDLSKKAEIILEPFSIDLNNKKIKSKLYQEIKALADDEFYELGLKLNSDICKYMSCIMDKFPYSLDYDEKWDISNLLKAYSVELSDDCSSLFERLLNYIKLSNQIVGTSIFIVLNAKQYLNHDQLVELYKMSFYSKIQLVLIEFCLIGNKESFEDIYILDEDNCIITY